MISYILVAIFFGLWYYFTQKPSIPKGLKPLPSPKGSLLYLGHSHLLGSKPHETFTNWSRELKSDIYSIKIGVLNCVILNSDKVVGDLLQKREAIYSSRLDSELYFRLLTRGSAIGFCPDNDFYKKAKAISVGVLSLKKTETYSPLIDKITKEMLLDVINTSTSLSNPEPLNPRSYLHRTTLNVILDVTFGIHTTSINDPLFKRVDKWVDEFIGIFADEHRRTEFFPILQYLPNKTLQLATAIRDNIDSIFGDLLEDIKSGKNKTPCAAREVYEKGELEDYQIVHLFAFLVLAGTETVAASLTWIIAFLANNPSFQKPAHKELEALIPENDRLPTYADLKKLPFTLALIREGLRIYAPTWLGVQHANEIDDEYNGYHIPAYSSIFINCHAIATNEQRHKNPMQFDPYRFINEQQSMASLADGPAEKRDTFVFGAGKRLCTGIHLAEAELFTILSRILYCFNIVNASPNGEDGKPIPINLNKSIIGLTIWPEDYNIKLVPRNDRIMQLIKE
ncbi:11570_t:CDS:2 [Funneliformis geosporum]|uniref:14249_t:CDS:1 n=1 Tax=Funneliformis geosporum TaxID=1117311 RepID=A0A9W4SJI3_9GLOM|nr:11570_t:CDS:2 [Funneliformis geosporum]CAI2171826.1 14249_t:CDS:2 [Funneliformis geosporum]